jgi:osmotically-inducible protein OsmY
VHPSEVKKQVEQALLRIAQADAERITVEVDGSKVILKGMVRIWAERQEAEHAAWKAPGVSMVDNRITIGCDDARPTSAGNEQERERRAVTKHATS